MSKYKERGPYHFVEYADPNSPYHAHVEDLGEQILRATGDLVGTWGPLTLHEVGCGEGLILHKLSGWFQRMVELTGNDIDPLAVRMAAELLHPSIRVWDKRPDKACDVVLFADSLEHIENWREHVEWAQRAQCVVIAVPSIPDRHAINHNLRADTFDVQFDATWKLVHRKTREFRHLSIWVRPRGSWQEHVQNLFGLGSSEFGTTELVQRPCGTQSKKE